MSHWQFPQWNYGYTQMPNYNYYGPPGPYSAPSRGGGAGPRRGGVPFAARKKQQPPSGPVFVKAEQASADPPLKPSAPGAAREDGEIVEKSLLAILKGRNPVMFCNDQSKLRGLEMEWEQISETGPPHDKTYQYQLKMGDLVATGLGKNKKEAKTKAAEDMVLKLDDLPKLPKRPLPSNFYGGFGSRGGYMGRGGRMSMPPWKRRKEAEENILKKNDKTPKVENPSQNNPVSKLYEHCKKKKWPEPVFDCVAEEVLDERRSEKGFILRKTNFTLMCTVRKLKDDEAIFYGTALTKKAAKTAAASSAWNAIAAESMPPPSSQPPTQKQSNVEKGDGTTAGNVVPVGTPAQPKVVMHR